MEIFWEYGSAYDFFASLHVLHNPNRFGLRGVWAAGVRSRLTPETRKVLEQASRAIFVPLHWIHALPEPHSVSDEDDLSALRAMRKEKDWTTRRNVLESTLSAWAAQETFGENLLVALRVYNEVFFAEEEKRIMPVLEQVLHKAQTLAVGMPWPQLLESLSRGVRFSADLQAEKIVLVPSYWTTPLVVFQQVTTDTWLLLFGGRPDDVSLVPGEMVPDTLLRVLKALGDPTRLRILRYLTHEPMTPSALAKKLRLRAPTVVHHLNVLRLAGLVYLNLDIARNKNERLYMARLEMVQQSFSLLSTFLSDNETNNQ